MNFSRFPTVRSNFTESFANDLIIPGSHANNLIRSKKIYKYYNSQNSKIPISFADDLIEGMSFRIDLIPNPMEQIRNNFIISIKFQEHIRERFDQKWSNLLWAIQSKANGSIIRERFH